MSPVVVMGIECQRVIFGLGTSKVKAGRSHFYEWTLSLATIFF